MAAVSMKELLEAGVHFGHQTPRWHPRMQSFIFTQRNGIHIIDLQQTIDRLEEACQEAREVASRGGVILFVGTKKQAQENLAAAAESCGMPYVSQRWLGGTLTNFRTIRQRVEYLQNLEARHERGDFEGLPKKEMLQLLREIERLNGKLGGIRDMRGLPDMLFIVDVRREEIAVKEATRLGIPIMALVDTNVDPSPIHYPIPSNDDAIRAIKLITEKVAEAVADGVTAWRAVQAEEALAFEEEAALPELKVIARAEEARLAAETAGEEAAVEADEEPRDEAGEGAATAEAAAEDLLAEERPEEGAPVDREGSAAEPEGHEVASAEVPLESTESNVVEPEE